ncbi:MAG: ParA family protein [Hydrogenophaga sp.]|nr:ParA family protein [Hydrogenophaga sp.]
MGTIAIVSRKGGSGKSTLATNLASYLARRNDSVTLGDLDHQQSMRVWLSRRPSAAPRIVGWLGDSGGLARPLIGTQHLILDTPGGLHGLGLAKVVMAADANLLPVAGSVFDRESASDCWNELRAHPKVASGRCRVAALGMRLDGRTGAGEITEDWAASVGLPYIGALRAAQVYVRAVENGISIFDMPETVTQVDRLQWLPILAWVDPVLGQGLNEGGPTDTAQASARVVPLRPITTAPVAPAVAASVGSAHPAGDSGSSSGPPWLRWLPGFLKRRR